MIEHKNMYGIIGVYHDIHSILHWHPTNAIHSGKGKGAIKIEFYSKNLAL